MTPLEYAYTAVDITPAAGTMLDGYEERRISTGVHDRLFLRMLLMDAGERVALVAMDSLLVDGGFCRMLSDIIRKKCAASAVLVGSTHSHSAIAAAAGSNILPVLQPQPGIHGFLEAVSDKLDEGPDWMHGGVYFGNAPAANVGSNRIVRGGYFRPVLSCMTVGERRSRHVFASYPCHATVLPPSNLLISRDYPGYFVDALEKLHGIAGAMFINGFAGNISTRFDRTSQDFSEAEMKGTMLASAFASMPAGRRLEDSVRVNDVTVRLERKKTMGKDELNDELERESTRFNSMSLSDPGRRLSYTRMQGIRIALRQLAALRGIDRFTSRISVVGIGGMAVVALPSEPFNEFSEIIGSGLTHRGIMTLGYCNDYTGYWPYPVGYTGESYEFYSSFVSQASVYEAVDRAGHAVAEMLDS